MKRCMIAILLAICVLILMFSAGCGKKKKEEQPKLNYSDDYQAAAQVDYDTLSVQIRTSSAAYFSGSIISVTAVIENKSENYYKVAPAGNGFDISVKADGYDLIPSGAAVSASDAPLILEPNGSVNVTCEYKSKVNISGEEKMLWECEPVASVNVKISDPAISRQAAIDADFKDAKTAKTSFMMYGTGEKPEK